jgi:hypothetical protein
MNEEYLKSLYDWIGNNDRTFPTDIPYEQFKVKMQDPAYVQKMHGWIVSKDPSFANDLPIDAFNKKIKGESLTQQPTELKKKEDTTVLPSGVGSSALSKSAEEQDYFTGTFGNLLKGIDEVSPVGIGDFVDDMARALAAGYRQGDVAQIANRVLLSGTVPKDEEIQNLIDKQEKLKQLGASKELQDYQKIYEEEGKGVWGVVKGLMNNPTVLPEVMVSSYTSMATNKDALLAGLGALATGAATGAYTAGTAGAAGGSVVPGAGTAIGGTAGLVSGAISGAASAVPYAFGLASTILETGSTFSELLTDELNGAEPTKENVKKILEDPDKYNDIRNKAIARGLTIGAVDFFTGKLASSVGGKIIAKSAAKSATGEATKRAVVGTAAAGAGIESTGGALGEATARALIGQEMDTGEILLEGIAEMPGGLVSTLTSMVKAPTYTVNGQKVNADEIDNLLNTMSPEDLAKVDINIENDFEGRKTKLQDILVSNSIKQEIKKAQPDLNEPTVNAIVELQKELNKLEGNKTQVAKDKAAQIRAEIKNLQENPLPEPIAPTAKPSYKVNGEEVSADVIDNLLETKSKEELLALNIQISNDTEGRVEKFQEIIQPIKPQEDAIQEQAAGQVPVQPTTTISAEVAQGEPQAEPQVTAEAGVQEEVVSLKTPITEEVKLEEVKTPRLVRDISVLITPATVRGASPITKRIKDLSLKYDKLVKRQANNPQVNLFEQIKETENQILNDAKQEIIDEVSKVDGALVKFESPRRGLWDNFFEPSFNMTLSVTAQADTDKTSKLLFDFAEKYSQDAFILESDSQYEDAVSDGTMDVPLSQFDENGLVHYPQIVYNFVNPITDTQVNELSNKLQEKGVDAFSINNNELKVSVIKFFPEDTNLTEEEQYQEKSQDYARKSLAIEEAANEVVGPSVYDGVSIRIKKSSYQGATNEKTRDLTRQYNRSDIFKPFQKGVTKIELLSSELSKLRDKQISLQSKGKQLSVKDKERFDELNQKVQPITQGTFEANKKLYEDAKIEVEKIAGDAIKGLNASLSPFPIKRPARASVKTIRWYGGFTEKLGDGARVNIVVNSEADADKVFKSIDKKNPVARGDFDLRRITDKTNLGYPKRLIEIRTSNGIIAEIQVITNEAYLAKDGINGFTGDKAQKDLAKKKLEQVRKSLGWAIPDGLGHYFYEINRDINVDDDLRAEASRLSNIYYDAFTNPKSKVDVSFMNDVLAFKEKVDAADKKNWDAGNEGKAPNSLEEYISNQEPKRQLKTEPITASNIKVSFAPENAIEVKKGTREDIRGGKVTYDASVTSQVTDKSNTPIGIMTRKSDGEGKLSFTIKDINGRDINKGKTYPTERDAKIALIEFLNKQKEKQAAKQKPIQTEDIIAAEEESEGVLESTFDFLDALDKDVSNTLKTRANDVLLGIPLTAVQGIIKGLKVLVKGGMKLRDAIKKIATDNNISQDTLKDLLNLIPIQEEFNKVISRADELITRQRSKKINDKKILTNLEAKLRKEPAYINGTDSQRKIMEREVRAKMGAEPRKAASIGRVIGTLKDITNVTREEKLKIISRIRELGKDVGKELAKEIRAMKVNGQITTAQATNIISRLTKVNPLNETSVSNFVDYMAEVFANVKEKNRQSLLKDLVKLVSEKAKTAKTESGKRRSKGLDAVGQAFFDAIKPIINAAANNDVETLQKIKDSIDNDLIQELMIKTLNGQELTTRERVLLDQALAYDTFADVANMKIEQIQELYNQLKNKRTESIANLKSKRIERAEQTRALHEEVNEQIKKGFGVLYNEDGTLKNDNQLRAESDAIWDSFQNLKIWDGVKKLFERYDFTISKNIFDFIRKTLSHIGTISKTLDKGGEFFTDNVYRALNKMDTAHLEGYFNEMEVLDEMANKIDGITKGYKQFRSKMSNKVITLDNIKDSMTGAKWKNPINQDQAMRIYALYKNPIQKEKLIRMGFDEANMQKIEDFIGTQGKQMADMIVDYFSNEYYESVNKVYRQVNDVSLGYVENYFPTQTIATGVGADMIIDGNFSGIFDAETAPSLKERTDKKSDVALGAAFTDVVESHIQTMERYKAYAEGVKRINSIFKSPAVKTLLGRYGTELNSVYKSLINFAINPNGGAKIQQTTLDKVMNKFAGFALAFKLIQIPKQATSFITAFEDYNYRGKGKKRIPGLDTLMFMVDTAKTIATLPIQVRKAQEISASFRDRLAKGLEGDVYGLESGSLTFKPIGQRNTLWGRISRALKKGAGFPTVMGDILGVMGYMINYNRNIANGMSKEDALEVFNNYNATQQSRRAADKIPLQQSQSALGRAFTMFGSTTFLQINKVIQGMTNIMRSLKEKKMPDAKDMRAVALNFGLANAFFVLASNMGKIIEGDDEDRERVLQLMGEALIGLNLIYQIPLLGGAIEVAIKKAKGDRSPTSDVINPYITVFNKIYKGVQEDDLIKSGQPIIEIILGTQLDQFVGLYNLLGGDFKSENVYDALGITKSFRPGESKSTSKKSDQKGMTKAEMKKQMPKMYEEIYGETDEMLKEIREEKKKILEEAGIEYEEEELDLEQ